MDITCNKSHKPFWIFFSFFLLSLFTFNTAMAQGDPAAGEKVFKQNCGVCHSMGDNVITGPGLKDVFSRVPSEDWMKDWIRNPDAMKKKDAYASALDKKYPSNMTAFAFLSDAEMDNLIAYIKTPPAAPVATDGPKGPDGETSGAPAEEGLDPLLVLLAVIAFLFIIITVLRTVRQSLRNVVNAKQGLPEQPSTGFMADVRSWINRNKRIVALFIIILIGYASKWAWDGMMGIGVYAGPGIENGYKPSQPIKFSHKIHANDNGIACVYCHSSVENSKTAGIPPVSTCMNCHKGIQQGATTGTEEIAKIHEAAGFDPKTNQYDPSKAKPIVWNKVHNLPDFVYFNHSQHVVVGKRQCEDCHGDVKSMDVVEQVAPLTMGWCIDCHKKTEVAMNDNPYYERVHTYLKEKYKGQETFTVDKIGGLDCVKCHY